MFIKKKIFVLFYKVIVWFVRYGNSLVVFIKKMLIVIFKGLINRISKLFVIIVNDLIV